MTARIGHNGGPEIEGRKVSIRTAWAKALFADPETPTYVMAMAWAIHWYSRTDGSGAALSNLQFKAICGISEDTATRGKKWLRDRGYVHLIVGSGLQKTQFQMVVPELQKNDDTLRCERTPPPPAADPPVADPLTADTPPLTAEQGVRPERTHIQYIDSGSIQERPRAHSRKGKPAASYWQQALNPEASEGVEFVDGRLTLVNGVRATWLERFGGDEKRLDLALTEVTPFMQPNGNRPLIIQLEAKLAKIAGEKLDRDERYAKAAKPGKGISRLKDKFLKAIPDVGGVK